jgi:hypothetical protein
MSKEKKVITVKQKNYEAVFTYSEDKGSNPRLEEIRSIAKRLLAEDLTKDSGLTSTDPQFQNSMEALERALTS